MHYYKEFEVLPNPSSQRHREAQKKKRDQNRGPSATAQSPKEHQTEDRTAQSPEEQQTPEDPEFKKQRQAAKQARKNANQRENKIVTQMGDPATPEPVAPTLSKQGKEDRISKAEENGA